MKKGNKETIVKDVMNVEELANYLGVEQSLVYKKSQLKEIPAVKIGKLWRFYKPTINKWLIDQSEKNLKKKKVVNKEIELGDYSALSHKASKKVLGKYGGLK